MRLQLILIFSLAINLMGQPAQLRVGAQAPPPVSQIGCAVTGGGGTTLYYYVVARYPSGLVFPGGGPTPCPGTPGLGNLTAQNFVTVNWSSPSSFVTGYDVLVFNNSLGNPNCASCAITLNTASNSFVQNSSTTFAYPPSGTSAASSVTAYLLLDNISAAQPFLNLLFPSSGSGRITPFSGSFTAGHGVLINADGTLSDSGAIGGGGGTVTQVNTTSPITGGPITTTGTIACATCGVTGSPLSQFAATTSAQLAGVLSDETGTGLAAFNNGPTFIAPILGTPTSGTLTNATGLPLTTGVTGVLPVANGGTATSSTLVGVARGGNSFTAAELSGDATTSGSNAVTVAKVNGVSYPASPAAHTVPVVTTASTTATYKTVPDCTDTGGNHINYTQSTDAFSCGTSGGAPAGAAGGSLSGTYPNPTIANFPFTSSIQCLAFETAAGVLGPGAGSGGQPCNAFVSDQTPTTSGALQLRGGISIDNSGNGNGVTFGGPSNAKILYPNGANTIRSQISGTTTDAFFFSCNAATYCTSQPRYGVATGAPTAALDIEPPGCGGNAGCGTPDPVLKIVGGTGEGSATAAPGADASITGGAGGSGATANGRGGNVSLKGGTAGSGGGTAAQHGVLNFSGHIITANVAGTTTVGTCGTSPSITGNDIAGLVTTGSSATTSCVVTFAKPYVTNAPICVVSDDSAIADVSPVSTTTTLTLSYGTATSINISYICLGF